MQARSLLVSVKWRQKVPTKTYSAAKLSHPTHKVSDGSRFFFPELSAGLPLFWKSQVCKISVTWRQKLPA